MAKDRPRPFLLRLVLWLIGVSCALAIVTVAVLLPIFLVANWGGAGPDAPLGFAEILACVGILAAGFVLPAVVLSPDSRSRSVLVPLALVLGGALIWPFVAQDPEPFIKVIPTLGVMPLGLMMYWVFGLLGRPAAPRHWQDMP